MHMHMHASIAPDITAGIKMRAFACVSFVYVSGESERERGGVDVPLEVCGQPFDRVEIHCVLRPPNQRYGGVGVCATRCRGDIQSERG